MSQEWRKYKLLFFLQVLHEDRDPMKNKKHDRRKLFLVKDWPQPKRKKDDDVNDRCKIIFKNYLIF